MVAMTASSWPIRRTRSMRPDSSTHQSSAGRPSSKSRTPARTVSSVPDAASSATCASVKPSRIGTRAQLVDEAHVVAR